MSKICTIYKDSVDKAWFNSSNIVYSECIDKKDELKEVNVVFKNGTEYTYLDVAVQDYLMFREDASQGKALNKFLKKYDYIKKEEKRDLELLTEEMEKIISTIKEAQEKEKWIM